MSEPKVSDFMNLVNAEKVKREKQREETFKNLGELLLVLFGIWASWRGYLALAAVYGGPALSIIEFFGIWFAIKTLAGWVLSRAAPK